MELENYVEEIRRRLISQRGNFNEVAKHAEGLSVSWLSKFANGKRANPTVKSLKTLASALEQVEQTAA